MEIELLFALIFIGVVLLLMRPRNYRRWTGWLGRRSRSVSRTGEVAAPPRQHRVRPEASRLSDEDVAARLERALGDFRISAPLLVRLASELNAYRLSPWNARKVVWIEDLTPEVAPRLAAALGSLEMGDLTVLDWKGVAPEGASRWVCVVTGEFPEADLSKALVFVLGPASIPERYRLERW